MLDVVFCADGGGGEEVRLLQTPGTSSETKLPILGCATQAGNNSQASNAEEAKRRPFTTPAHLRWPCRHLKLSPWITVVKVRFGMSMNKTGAWVAVKLK